MPNIVLKRVLTISGYCVLIKQLVFSITISTNNNSTEQIIQNKSNVFPPIKTLLRLKLKV